MYTLTIVKKRDNPNFAAKLEDYNLRSRASFGVQTSYPEEYITERVLDVTVTEEMFAAIRKACLEQM